ncbi:glycosyltransferase family 2 protein [Oribacterium sp. HCP28S3_H8]|uniref:glycosyltransferase family 2 protein n=1 Tax=Oribacterium sp. HCP28S3_H8 TaxID=3438945 RepID=UPI003F88B5AE
MRTRIDIAVGREGKLTLEGWTFGKDPETEVKYTVLDEKGREVPGSTYASVRRDEVVKAYFPERYKSANPVVRELGFDINAPYERGRTYYLLIEVDGKSRRFKFNDKILESFNSHAHKTREKLLALLNWETVEVSWEYLKEHGFGALWKKGIHKIQGIQEDYEYSEWWKATKTTDEELARQRETAGDFAVKPKFSIVIPVYKTPERFLRRMLESIQQQTYGNFEVCLVDATEYQGLKWMREDGKRPKDVLTEFAAADPRFIWKPLNRNLGISENTNAAIRMADGDYIVLADHDDELTPDALYECTKAINEHPGLKVIYSDEDKIDFESAYLFEPHFKTDYNPDLLRSVNYICHLFVAERKLMDEIAEINQEGEKIYERSTYDGAQDYDLILRCCERADAISREEVKAHGLSKEDQQRLKDGVFTSTNIYHVRKVLYHWRSHQLSTASNPEAKLYAFDAGKKAIYDHCKRVGLPIRTVEDGITYGIYHTIYDNENPLISVIIPNKDHTEDLDKAIRSLLKGNYQNLEFIVVENNSTKPETWEYYDKIQKELPCVKVVKWAEGFNFSAINNFGVQYAKGDYYLFLNNDIEMIAPDSISEMIGYVQREDVGVCGARLLYPDGTIQHAGVVMGFGGMAGHCFIGIHNDENTYMHRAKCIQDYSAVTAACMLVRKDVFTEVHGFTEEYAVAFNDIDFCMKVRAANKKVVYNPYAEFYHYESKSRGAEDTPEKVKRFNAETERLARNWTRIIKEGDPYYHPALTLRKSNFVLRDLSKEKVGEPFPLLNLKGITWD